MSCDCVDGIWLIVFLVTMYGIKLTIKPASTHVDVINIDTFIKRQDGYIEFQWFDHF